MAMRLFLINSFPPPQQLFLCLPFFYLPPNPPAPYSALASISFYSSIMQSLRGLCTGCSLCQKNSSLDTHMLIPLRSSNLCSKSTFSKKCTLKILVAQSGLTLCDPMDCSIPGSSIHGILQARILELVAIPFSRGSSWPRDQTQVSCIEGRFFIIWATREAQWNKGN